MRFFFVSTMFGAPWGGSEELWSQTALRLKESGHDVAASVCWWPKLSPKVTNLAGHGVNLLVQQRPTLPVKALRKIGPGFGLIRPEFKQMRRRKPDLVIISQGASDEGGDLMHYCLKSRLPYIPIVHAIHEGLWPSDEACDNLLVIFRAAQKVLCVSHRNLELLESQLGESLPNAEVVWNPYNVPADEPPPWPVNNGVWNLASVARLDPKSKGQDLLFQVLSRPKWRERPVVANLYGNGHCEQNLRRLAARHQLQNVNFRGHVNDVKKIWAENHLLVMPSRFEGLPLTLVEAMWCARPAVVTDVGGNAEVCVDGETGFIAAAPTANLFDEALERAWNQRERWPAIGLAARARADKLIPRDPVGDFSRLLTDTVAKS